MDKILIRGRNGAKALPSGRTGKSMHVPIEYGTQIPVRKPLELNNQSYITCDMAMNDDLFFWHILNLRRSSIHGAILGTKWKMIRSNGFEYDKDSYDPDSFGIVQYMSMFDHKELLVRTAIDYATFGGFAWLVKWSLTGDCVYPIRQIPIHKLRRAVENPNMFLYAEEWGLSPYDYDHIPSHYNNGSLGTFIKYPSFDENCPQPNLECILYFKRYDPLNEWYPVPDYFGGIDDILTDISIPKFNKRNVAMGFTPSAIVSIPNNPSDEVMKQIRNDISQQYGQGGAILLKGAKSGADASSMHPQVTPFTTTNNADIYIALRDSTRQGIISAHQLTSPSLAGIAVGGGIGIDQNRTAAEYELFYNTIIRDYQDDIVFPLNKLISISGVKGTVDLGSSQLFSKSRPQSYGYDYMTMNEQREIAGLEPFDDELANVPIFILNQRNININQNTQTDEQQSGLWSRLIQPFTSK